MSLKGRLLVLPIYTSIDLHCCSVSTCSHISARLSDSHCSIRDARHKALIMSGQPTISHATREGTLKDTSHVPRVYSIYSASQSIYRLNGDLLTSSRCTTHPKPHPRTRRLRKGPLVLPCNRRVSSLDTLLCPCSRPAAIGIRIRQSPFDPHTQQRSRRYGTVFQQLFNMVGSTRHIP